MCECFARICCACARPFQPSDAKSRGVTALQTYPDMFESPLITHR
jgi:hypothetical protein